MTKNLLLSVAAGLIVFSSAEGLRAAENPYLGDWALTIPGGHAGWLGVEPAGAGLRASMLWGWGSVEPLASASFQGGKLTLTKRHEVEITQSGRKVKKTIVETITATANGDDLQLTSVKPKAEGTGEDRAEFTGKRQPPMPPAPDLKQVKFGPAQSLFNGTDLTGWRLTDPNSVNGWSAGGGILSNHPVQEDGKPHKNYGNLRTDGEFSDFRLSLEVRVPEGGNSGIYLRGIYEVQVTDSYGKPLDSHHMGGIYSRIKPTVNAEKRAGEWQTMQVTLVKRHVTVVLNGKTIIDNQPVRGCTGGALFSDVNRPGPLYLQGDHTGVEYRNIRIEPVQ